MKVRHAMSTNVITATPDTPLIDAMRSMLREHISGLPVVDAHGALVGILTEADLMHRAEIETEVRHARPAWLDFILGPGRQARAFTASHARHVGEVMTRDVITVDAGAPLIDAISLMEKHGIKRLPVLRDQLLAGILSRADLLRAFVRALPEAAPDDVSDKAIAHRLGVEFDARPWAPRGTVRADVHDGVVTLRGVIVSDDVRCALLVLAENMAGVRRVQDQITTIEPMTGMVVHEPWAQAV